MKLAFPAVLLAPLLAAAVAAAPADAKTNSGAGFVLTYPSDDIPDASALGAAIRDPRVGTIIFKRGANAFSSRIDVFGRSDLVLCGQTNRASDTSIESSAPTAFLLDEVTGITFRDLTIRSSAPVGEAIRLVGARSATSGSFSRDVKIRGCRLEGGIPLRGTARAEGLDVADSTITVTEPSGIGLLWADGPSLLVTRTQFRTATYTSASDYATAALSVRGPESDESEGDRARRVILTRNRVAGNFAIGLDLADVVEARVLRNQVTFPSPLYGSGPSAAGRVGILVRRNQAASQPDDFDVRRNRVRNAHTGVWCLDPAEGRIISNDLRRCGSSTADTVFEDAGCALRVTLFRPICRLTIGRNDFRGLRSPAGTPAVVADPPEFLGYCFAEDGEPPDEDLDIGNRTDAAHPIPE